MTNDFDVTALTDQIGPWLQGLGPESDIVISSRIRLARNLADYPFIRRCTAADREKVARTVGQRLATLDDWSATHFADLGMLSELDRQFLVERQLISREIADGEGGRAAAIDPSERYSVMVNEEDHLRIQVMRSGLDLATAHQTIQRLDDQLESVILYAYHPRYGYLTACPTNVGTGLRVSVMLHLPGLVITRQIDKVFRSMRRINVTVRGLYGEGSQYSGDFYQVSNQVTLGKTEDELISLVAEEVVPRIIEYERKARAFLIEKGSQDLHDDVSRAMGILTMAKKITSEETMHYLSKVRMGIHLGLIDGIEVSTINRLFMHTQPAHLQKLNGGLMPAAERNVHRAKYLQRHLGEH